MILFFSGGTQVLERVLDNPDIMFSYYTSVYDKNNRSEKRLRRMLRWKKDKKKGKKK